MSHLREADGCLEHEQCFARFACFDAADDKHKFGIMVVLVLREAGEYKEQCFARYAIMLWMIQITNHKS